MTAPQALLEFFQKEATEYLDRLDRLLGGPEPATEVSAPAASAPDAAAFLASARALRGSASMTRLDGLPDFASTVERLAAGLSEGALRWDQRLHLSVQGALQELRALVQRAPVWSEADQRRARTQSVALASMAAGYLTTGAPVSSPAQPVVPLARFFPDDGAPVILERNPAPAMTLAQRFRQEVAAAAGAVAREANALTASPAGLSHVPITDGVRRALLGLAEVSESYGAASIAGLATRMARAPLASGTERAGVQALARLLMDRELTDAELAAQVRQASLTWSGAAVAMSTAAPAAAAGPAGGIGPSGEATVSVDAFLYRGHAAVTRARAVRDQLEQHWRDGATRDPAARALLDELRDLLDLALTT